MSSVSLSYVKTANTSVSNMQKVSLWERFKNYLVENADTICPGIIISNGGHYVPSNRR